MYELKELEIAERICPFGEYAENLRAQYLAAFISAALAGNKEAVKVIKNIEEFLFNM